MTCNQVAGMEFRESGKEIQNARESIFGSGQHQKEKKKPKGKEREKFTSF